MDLQTLLVLGDVLTNDMNAGVAWSFLGERNLLVHIYFIHSSADGVVGLTIRLAQSLGLHRPSPLSFPLVERNLRTEIWYVRL